MQIHQITRPVLNYVQWWQHVTRRQVLAYDESRRSKLSHLPQRRLARSKDTYVKKVFFCLFVVALVFQLLTIFFLFRCAGYTARFQVVF